MPAQSVERLLILGASARAAAFSALKAGLVPSCGDLFADADLRRVCDATAVDDYPEGLERVARTGQLGPWMYTGALENHPALVARISKRRELYGNGGEVLHRARDPLLVRDALQSVGFPAPECQGTPMGLPADGSWLRKRRRSAGGMHVTRWYGPTGGEERQDGWYFQRFISGESCAAAFVSARGEARLLGVTEQLLANEFRYAGSIGPLTLRADERAELVHLGSALAAILDLVGVWGVDLVRNDDGLWPIEVNPRYTASMEVIERASGFSIIGMHVAACRDGLLPDQIEFPTAIQHWHGKQIIYAQMDLTVSKAFATRLDDLNRGREQPVVADLPAVGGSIRRRHPICTAFAEAETREELMELMSQRCQEMGG